MDTVPTISRMSSDNDHDEENQTTRATTVSSSPSAIYAGLAREQWEDQQQRYMPFEQMVNDMILDPSRRDAIRQEGLDGVTESVDSSFNRASNQLETLRSRTNQSQSTRGVSSSNRLESLHKTAATVSARNGARQFMDETEDAILSGGT